MTKILRMKKGMPHFSPKREAILNLVESITVNKR